MQSDVTGRDSYITAKALAYAIAMIDQQAVRDQEVSDREDMVALLHQIVPDKRDRSQLANTVEVHTGMRPALWALWSDNGQGQKSDAQLAADVERHLDAIRSRQSNT